VREAGLAARTIDFTWSDTGITRAAPDEGVTATLPVYVPAGRLTGFIVTVRVAGVELGLAVALNHFPPTGEVLEDNEKPTTAPLVPESATVWTVGPDGTSNVSDVGEGMMDMAASILNVTGMAKAAKPVAVMVMVAV
jgi:hypothetical protein